MKRILNCGAIPVDPVYIVRSGETISAGIIGDIEFGIRAIEESAGFLGP